jgi:hypothetical protein
LSHFPLSGFGKVVPVSDGKILRILLAITTATIAATGTAPMERCRESRTTVGTQIQPIALTIVNRLKETEDPIPDGNQKNQVLAAPDSIATKT